MVSVCAPQSAPWQKVLDLAQARCAAEHKNATLIAGAGQACGMPGPFDMDYPRLRNFRCE